MAEKSILLLGVGNILYSDEGLGVHALRQIEAEYEFSPSIELLDGGTMGKLLMGPLMDHDMVVIMDAVLGGEAPGTVYRLIDEGLRKSLGFHDSQHQVDLVDTLISCELMGKRPQAVVIGMEPGDWKNLRDAMTEPCIAAMPKFIGHVIEELESLGVTAKRK